MGFCDVLCRLPHLSIAPCPREADRAQSRQIFSIPRNLLSSHKPSCKLTVNTGLQWLGLKSLRQERADDPCLAKRNDPQGRLSGFSKAEDIHSRNRTVVATGKGWPFNENDGTSGKGKARKGKGGKWQKWAAFGGVGLSVVAAAKRVEARGMPNAETGGGGGGRGGDNSGGGSGGGPGDGASASAGNLFRPATEEEERPLRRKSLPFAFLGGGDRLQPLNPGSPPGSKTELDELGTGSESPTTMEEVSVDGEEEGMSPLKTAVRRAEGNPLQQLWDRLTSVIRMLSDGQQKVISEEDLSLEELAAQEERQALLLDSAELALKLIDERTGAEAFARASEVGALRRLQREAFADLLKLRERVEKVEVHSGLSSANGSGESLGIAGRTRLSGEVSMGAAFLPTNDMEAAAGALEEAGMRSGVGVKLKFETPFREEDSLVTECGAGLGGEGSVVLGGPIMLHKLLYKGHLAPGCTVTVAPVGARGWDVTQSLNPMQGSGLTRFSSQGAPLHGAAEGTALGLTLEGARMTLAAAQFVSNWGSSASPPGPAESLCASSLLHLTLQPLERVLVSFSALNRRWPAPPLPSQGGIHWSELGPLVLPKMKGMGKAKPLPPPPTTLSGDDYEGPVSGGGASSQQTIAVSGAVGLGRNLSLGAWGEAEVGEEAHEGMHWNVALAKTPSLDNPIGFGVSVGSGALDQLRALTTGEGQGMGMGSRPIQMEAFLNVQCGRGLSVQPGVMMTRRGNSTHCAIMLRSSIAL